MSSSYIQEASKKANTQAQFKRAVHTKALVEASKTGEYIKLRYWENKDAPRKSYIIEDLNVWGKPGNWTLLINIAGKSAFTSQKQLQNIYSFKAKSIKP